MTRLDDHIARLRARNYPWHAPWDAVEALARSEDCRLVSYRCIAGVWTIAWGETEGVTANMQWTEDQCDARFLQQVHRYLRKIEALLTVPANENQLGAFLRLVYNIGFGAFAKSTALRMHNRGDFEAAARAFGLFNKVRNPATGQLEVARGLTIRRAQEAAAYLTPPDGAPHERMPQAVEGESSLAKSPITQGGAATVAAGAVTAGASVAEQFEGASTTLASVKVLASQVADFVGLPPGVLLAAVLIAAGIAVVKWRARQRAGGWA